MPIELLPGIPSQGTLSLTAVPVASLPDPTILPVDVVTGASAVHMSCLIPTGTYTGVTTDVNRIRKGRACSKEPYYVRGEMNRNLDRVQVVYDPQNPASPLSAVYAALVPDTEWYFIDRRGKSGQLDLAEDDYTDVMKVMILARNKPYSEEEGDESVVDILLAYGGTYLEDVQVAAAAGP